jgi:ankyrin repeat protein
VDLAQLLIDYGADVTASDKGGSTLLHRASRNGHVRLARLLVEHGADATAQDNDGSTPLHQASRRGSVDLARSLLAAHHAAVGDRPTTLMRHSDNLER